jgi:peptidyl-prolyl cis-trans isomerase C
MLDDIIATIPEENRVPFLTPDGRKKMLERVIGLTLFAEAARSGGMDKERPIQTRLGHLQDEFLAMEYMRRRQAKQPLVTEDDLKAYYKDHLDEFKPPEEIKVRHLVLKTEAEANNMIGKLKGGENFVELVKKHSIEPEAAKGGGRLLSQDGREWVPRGTFEKSFEHALFKIPPGDVGGPVKSQYGWHILKVEEKRQPPTPYFAQVRAMIKSRLDEQKGSEFQKQLTEELKKTTPVTVK